jgi:hypothetical protein
MRPMRAWPLILALSATGCGGGCRRPVADPAGDGGAADDAPAGVPAGDAAVARAACRSLGRRAVPALAQVEDGGGVEALVAAPSDGGVSVAWSLRGALGLWRVGQRGAASLGGAAGERSDPAVAADGRGALAAAWITSRLGAREHTIWTADGPAGRCVGAEGRDEGLSLALAGLARGWLVAWDEEGPAPAAGSIRAQVVAPGPNGLLCGAQRAVSPPQQDAADPVAVSMPDGRVALFWLTARDLDASESNDTATEVWGVLVGAGGAPVGPPLRVTRTVDHYFGLSGYASRDAVWLAARGGGPSDSEGRGDGGEVRSLRVDVGPSGLLRAGDVAVVTDDGGNPTGAPRVTRATVAGAAAEVWWRERHGERVEVRHRPLDATGRAVGGAWVEASMAGALPSWVDEHGVAWVARSGPDGAGLARFGCSPAGG